MELEFRGGLVGGIKEVQRVRGELAEIFPEEHKIWKYRVILFSKSWARRDSWCY